MTDQPSTNEFEEIVAAALKVDPAGLSGKHVHEQFNEQAQVGNKILAALQAKGLSTVEINDWCNTPMEELGGRTPNGAWNNGEGDEILAVAESLPSR